MADCLRRIRLTNKILFASSGIRNIGLYIFAKQTPQCRLHGLPAYRMAIACEMLFNTMTRLPAPLPGDKHQTDRLFSRAAAGPRDAGHGQGEIRIAMHQGAGNHFGGGLRADRAMGLQGGVTDPEHRDFRGVAVGHEAAVEPGRTAGDFGHALRDPAAGAGFGQGQQVACLAQLLTQLACER